MSLRRRLLNLAKGELTSAFRRLSGLGSAGHREPVDEAPPVREQRRTPVREDDDDEHIRRCYANLELPVGSSAAEVRAAYRRLIRRYHPDRHQQDAEAARLATELSQKLRDAQDTLLAHLLRRPRSTSAPST